MCFARSYLRTVNLIGWFVDFLYVIAIFRLYDFILLNCVVCVLCYQITVAFIPFNLDIQQSRAVQAFRNSKDAPF